MNKIAFEIFGVGIAWYGIIIASAMMIGTLILMKIGKKYGYKENDILDLVMVILPTAIVFARLYYVAFEWDYYSQNLMKVVAFREGGLAIHGGIIGGLIGGYVVCRVKKLNFPDLADMVSMPLILGQAIGRWGNFINQEAHGGPTDLPWGIMVDGVKVHPTFLYESLWNLVTFVILVVTFKKRRFYGEHFIKYLILYSIGRFYVEGLRTDSLMLGDFRIAQLFSLASIVLGILAIVGIRKKGWLKIQKKEV
ncbi:prolipoprotein diacylglyceryl transferase [Fusibacter tunisiensis]|uniref:Phosphatidylglycerol--prolipoprotein diacylglyceryl transferase n=1 Tax=Fusibacter tunisiensis TaxID=1008308 RepID=A0ABS2MMD8_9FIRM|nr:prolipoprotein diacylglyceryl transferase [Fusibacter tunisiensis]MBM7560492.1 prolipoprotein diacylglyceryl transferase [Fusibacter tunisiensis]